MNHSITEIKKENQECREKLHTLRDEILFNRKDLRYELGKMILENRKPLHKIFSIWDKMKKMREEYRVAVKAVHIEDEPYDENSIEDALEYNEKIKEEITQLEWYLALKKYDLEFALGTEVLLARESIGRLLLFPFALIKVWAREQARKHKIRKRERARERRIRKRDRARERRIRKRDRARAKRIRIRERDRQWRIREREMSRAKRRVLKLFHRHSHNSGGIHLNLGRIEELNSAVLFIATNGAGLGHLTRCLAVARQLKKKQPDVEIIFLTTSLALTIVHREGFTAYCIPSRMLIKGISPKQWNAMLRMQLAELMQLYNFSTIIFDGASPYASISAAIAEENDITKIWIKRGGEKDEGIAEARAQMEEQFDMIIIPGEAGNTIPENEGQHRYVNPILYLNRDELWSREDVRKYLKIPEGKKAVYVQLGAGNINDIDSDIGMIVRELRRHDDIVMIIGESMIGQELKIIEDDIIIIKDYPNSKYFNGFDFAISACGYNTFHEMVYNGLPTLFLPNMQTKTDDQYGRAMIAVNHGVGTILTELKPEALAQAIDELCDGEKNKKMRELSADIMEINGADEAAAIIAEEINYIMGGQ